MMLLCRMKEQRLFGWLCSSPARLSHACGVQRWRCRFFNLDGLWLQCHLPSSPLTYTPSTFTRTTLESSSSQGMLHVSSEPLDGTKLYSSCVSRVQYSEFADPCIIAPSAAGFGKTLLIARCGSNVQSLHQLTCYNFLVESLAKS
jgi:hypothetical protein